MKQKGFVVLPVIIITLVGIIGYLVYQNSQLRKGGVNTLPTVTNIATTLQNPSPTIDPTVNWKTYTNPRYKFTFKYPRSLTVTNYTDWMYDAVRLEYYQETSSSTASPNVSKTQTKINTGSPKSAEILLDMVEVTDTSSTAEKYSNEIYNTEKTDKLVSVAYSPIKTTLISGRNAYYFEKTNSQVTKEIFVDLDMKTILRINIYSSDALVDQILSTFKFTQ